MTVASVVQTLNNAASYTWGNCTYYVAKIASWVPTGLGNARDWLANARAKGLQTSSMPTVGSVAVSDAGQFGHVAYVTAVHPNGTFDVSEMNFSAGLNQVDTRSGLDPSQWLGFILPPTGAAPAVLPAAGSTSSSPPSSSSANCSPLDPSCWWGVLQQDLRRGFWIAVALGIGLVGVLLLVVEDVEHQLKAPAADTVKGAAANPEVIAA